MATEMTDVVIVGVGAAGGMFAAERVVDALRRV